MLLICEASLYGIKYQEYFFPCLQLYANFKLIHHQENHESCGAAGIGAGGGAPLRHDISGSEGSHRSVQALCHPHQSRGEKIKLI